MKKTNKPPSQDQFVALRFEMKESRAWRAMSGSARVYYLELKSTHRTKPNNNGQISLTQREAMKATGFTRPTIERAHEELIHFGFIVETRPAYLGKEGKGRAPLLRLTELDTDKPATKEYLRWNGKPFVSPVQKRLAKKTESRQTKLANPGKQCWP
jgi:hypothetical protein